MPKVTGDFEITLRTPIPTFFDVNKVADLHLDLKGIIILIRPLEPRPHLEDDNGELVEPPMLDRLRIWITRDVREPVNAAPLLLPTKERERFESIIIEATRRFVKTVAAKTGNWELDYRQPVDCYTSKYFLEDQKLPAEFLEESTHLVPRESVEGLIIWHSDEFIGDLTEDIWKDLTSEIQEPMELNHYDEAIFDAMRFRRLLRYDTAVLYAAFAGETILKEIGVALLDRKGLTIQQIDIFLEHVKMPSLIKLIETFPNVSLPKFGKYKLEKLFEARNAVAHKKKTSATGSEASSAIRVAFELKKVLHNLSES